MLLSARDAQTPIESIAGETMAMQRLRATVALVSAFAFPILVVGERGSGKGLVARVGHACRGGQPDAFFPVNCAAVPATLAESQLFGHEKGAFTGAHHRRAGLFATAFRCNGTLYLDDVADFSPEVQPKILQAVEDRVFFAVGSDRPTALGDDRAKPLRIWSSAQPASVNRLRPDLLDRLSTLVITIPPLRERPFDILLLADGELRRLNAEHGRRLELTRAARAALLTYDWPGNVRQARNVLDRAFVLSRDETALTAAAIAACIDEERQLDRLVSRPSPEPAEMRPEEPPQPLKDFEAEHIFRALRIANGNISQAAQILGLKRTTLQSRLRVLPPRPC
jgi:DNA-binding NtrC family response regulator